MPSGRVGNAKDAIFRSNDHFRQAVAEREECDVAELQHRLDRSLEKAERARIGVGQLRRFLEQLLQRRYIVFWLLFISSVPKEPAEAFVCLAKGGQVYFLALTRVQVSRLISLWKVLLVYALLAFQCPEHMT